MVYECVSEWVTTFVKMLGGVLMVLENHHISAIQYGHSIPLIALHNDFWFEISELWYIEGVYLNTADINTKRVYGQS